MKHCVYSRTDSGQIYYTIINEDMPSIGEQWFGETSDDLDALIDKFEKSIMEEYGEVLFTSLYTD